jgi:hypothetical protein
MINSFPICRKRGSSTPKQHASFKKLTISLFFLLRQFAHILSYFQSSTNVSDRYSNEIPERMILLVIKKQVFKRADAHSSFQLLCSIQGSTSSRLLEMTGRLIRAEIK